MRDLSYALQAAGLLVDTIEPGRLIRCRTVDDKHGQKSGYYRAFDDGGLVYGDWRTGQQQVLQPDGFRNNAASRAMLAQARREREEAQRAEWRENAKRLARTWNRAKVCQPGGLIERYLSSRGLSLPDGDALRGASLPYWLDGEKIGVFPTMLAQVQAPDGTTISLHRTFLSASGGKAAVPSPKKLMPAAGRMSGASIRLMQHGERLGISEGIETALSAAMLFGVPCWAAVSARGLASWEPPAGVTTVDIFADHDTNGTGRQAAEKLARRLSPRGLTVRIHTPEMPGDWNDALGEMSHDECQQ